MRGWGGYQISKCRVLGQSRGVKLMATGKLMTRRDVRPAGPVQDTVHPSRPLPRPHPVTVEEPTPAWMPATPEPHLAYAPLTPCRCPLCTHPRATAGMGR